MSNKIIIIWGTTVILMCSIIFLFGKSYEKNYKYYETNKEVKRVIKEYIDEKDIKIQRFSSLIISSDDTLKEVVVNDMNCKYEVVIRNYIVLNSYKIDYKCINEITK